MSTKPVKRKRRTIWVEYDEESQCWLVHRPESWETKEKAVEAACAVADARWKKHKEPCEVIVRTKAGYIGAGKGSRFTYGRDPRRSVG